MRVIDNATVEVTATYNEPAKSQDGSPLTDLAYTSIFYRVGTGPAVAAAVTPASATTGGGAIVRPLIVPAPVGARTSFSFWATATDTSGNVSSQATATFEVERFAPEAPSNFTIA